MNKKLFLGMFAAAGMLLATSCSNDELDVVQSGNEAQVTFSLGLEGGIATRAISDGTGAKKLVCAVYDANDNVIKTISINNTAVNSTTGQFVNTSAFQGGLTDQINVTLAKGQTYTMVFWAQNGACDAYNTDDLKAVEVDYTNGAEGTAATGDFNNDETRDAFYAAETFKVEGNKEINVTLKRPFAQINVGVYKSDWEAAVASGIEIEKSSVVIKNAATSINLLTGEVGEEETDVTVSYTANTIPQGEMLKVDTDGDGEKEEYHWLSMSYILVADHDETEDANGLLGTDKATLQGLQYTFIPESGEPIAFAEGLAGAPVQRNWRTNIIGKILTGDVTFNITIDPAYDGDYIYPNGQEQELAYAAAFGGTVTLTKNVTLTEPLNVTADMILNLNGNTISGNWHKENGAIITNSANLKIVNGTISSTAGNGGSVIQNNGTMIVEDATLNGAPNEGEGWPSYAVNNKGNLTLNNVKVTSYHGGIASYNDNAVVTLNNCALEMSGIQGFTSHGFYTYNNGAIVVNGGTYANNATDQNSSGASVINGAVTVNSGTFTGRIENYYGTPVLKGGTYSVEPKTNFVADGYKSLKSGDNYVVVANEVDAVADSAEDLNALSGDTKNVLLMAKDLEIAASETTANSGYGATGVSVKNGSVFDGNGNTITVNDANGTWDCAINPQNGTVKNLTVNGAFRGIFMGSADGDVFIDNVVIDNVCYTFNSDGGNKNYGVYISNSTLNGWTSFSDVHKEVIFTNCKFGKGSGGYSYAFCRPYNACVFENCEFAEGYEFDTSKQTSIVFKNCTYGGVKITAENAATLALGETTFFYNGVGSVSFQ